MASAAHSEPLCRRTSRRLLQTSLSLGDEVHTIQCHNFGVEPYNELHRVTALPFAPTGYGEPVLASSRPLVNHPVPT